MSEDTHPAPDPTEHEIRIELDRVLRSSLFLNPIAWPVSSALPSRARSPADRPPQGIHHRHGGLRPQAALPPQPGLHRAHRSAPSAREAQGVLRVRGQAGPCLYLTSVPAPTSRCFGEMNPDRAVVPQASPENDLVVHGVGVGVAVLPLIDLSDQPRSALCAQGVTEELIHALTRADGIRVIARPIRPPAGGATARHPVALAEVRPDHPHRRHSARGGQPSTHHGPQGSARMVSS